ncbi:MAG: ABC transporter permease [Lachnospiraceae bacterium]|nr:ABC transporter permease [Lachnospiraceae bacterium]
MSKKRRKTAEERRQYIFALRQLVSREVKRKYARSYLGIVWSVLNPLLSMAVLSMIFSTIFKRSIENYPIYFLTGQILWQLFSGATNSAMTALVDNKSMLIKVKLSKQTFVLSRVLTAFTNFLYTFIAYILMLIVFGTEISWTMLLFPIAIIGLLMFALGLGLLLSVAYVFFGDIKYLYSVLLTLWMYMSAIFYPVDNITPIMQTIVGFNPVYAYIQFARECMMYQTVPEASCWLKVILWGVGMFVLGYRVFKDKENAVMQKV